MKKSSNAAGLTRRVLSAVQQPQGNVSELPPIADAMDAMMADIERGRPKASGVRAQNARPADRRATPPRPAFAPA